VFVQCGLRVSIRGSCSPPTVPTGYCGSRCRALAIPATYAYLYSLRRFPSSSVVTLCYCDVFAVDFVSL
jgi:hypothetical protein